MKPIGISYAWRLHPSTLTRARARTQPCTKTPAPERNSRERFPVFLGAPSSLKPIGISCVWALRPSAPTLPRPPNALDPPTYHVNITNVFFQADFRWHCVQRDLRSLLVNSSPLVLPLECRHPRKRIALLRVGAFVAQLSATRAHSNTAVPGMRRDCPENARPTCREHRPERRERPTGNANIRTQMQIQILTSISPFKTQNQEGKLRRQRTRGFARPRERNRDCARALAGNNFCQLHSSREARSENF